jgi:hypothetical protein
MTHPHKKRKHGKDENEKWPSLEEQFKASKVIPGSALEKLIRDNRDFAMLDPADAADLR